VEHFCVKFGDPGWLQRFLRYRADKRTDRQTHRQTPVENPTPATALARVIIMMCRTVGLFETDEPLVKMTKVVKHMLQQPRL